MEYCYICFLVGHNFQAFEHWKKLFSLMCSCIAAVEKYEDLFIAFVSLMKVQIMDIPQELLSDIALSNNFIYAKLRNFLRNVSDLKLQYTLRTDILELKQMVAEKYNWKFDDLEEDDDDELPVIVTDISV